jgi:acyl-CoA thioester hydrolase
MARIHIDLPPAFVFTAELQVRFSDLNYGGHVGNDAFLTLMQEARILYYRSLGFSSEISFDGAVGQIITDAAVQYKAQAFMGDELLINIGITDFSKYGFDMVYQIVNKVSGTEVGRGKTGIVCYDYERKKIVPVPELLLTKLQP